MWLFDVMGAILTVAGMWLAFNLVRGLWAVVTGKEKLRIQPMTLEELDEIDETETDPIYSCLEGNINYDYDDD